MHRLCTELARIQGANHMHITVVYTVTHIVTHKDMEVSLCGVYTIEHPLVYYHFSDSGEGSKKISLCEIYIGIEKFKINHLPYAL